MCIVAIHSLQLLEHKPIKIMPLPDGTDDEHTSVDLKDAEFRNLHWCKLPADW